MQNIFRDRKYNIPSRYILGYLGVFLTAIFLTGVLIFIFGYDPVSAYYHMFNNALGSTFGIAETLTFAIPLFLCAMSITIAMRMGLTNLGAEGQLYLGSIGATFVALYLPVPDEIRLITVIIFGFVFGAVYALIPAIMKVRYGVSEIFVGLMLNFVGLFLVHYLVEGPWIREGWGAIATSERFPLSAQIPKIIVDTRLHFGLILAILVGILVYFLLKKTAFGYEIKVVGFGEKVARYSGINISKTVLFAALLSGGFAGLAGMIEVSGVLHLLVGGFSPGYGYLAFGAVLMGRLNPAGVGITSFLFAILLGRVESLQRTVGISLSFFYALVAIIILLILVFEPIIGKVRK